MASSAGSIQNYIVSQDPTRFGGKQAEYEAEVEEIVVETAHRFSAAIVTGEDLEALFFKTLEGFGKKRNEIATRHGTPFAERFGVLRDSKEAFDSSSMFAETPLKGVPYYKYHTQVLELIQAKLREINFHSIYGVRDKFKRFEYPPILGRRAALDIEIFSIEQFMTWLFPFNDEGAAQIAKLVDYPPPTSGEDLNVWFKHFFGNKEMVLKLKKVAFDVYKKAKLFVWVNRNNELTNFAITDHIYMTLRIEVDGRMAALSQFVTWLQRDGKGDPIEAMKTRSSVLLVHQDLFLIETMLKEAAALFKSALTCDRADLKTLKGRVALWTTVFDNAMPFDRGSSAVSEWFQQAIYRALGYRLTFKPDKLVNLEVLTKPFPQVVKEYDSMVELRSI